MARPTAISSQPTVKLPRSKTPGRIILRTGDLVKSYRKGPVEVPVLKGVNLEIPQGKLTAIVGQSGSGKSTLLHLLATLDEPDSGQIFFHDRRIDNLPAKERDRFRNHDIGIIFQFYHLLPELTTVENVLVPRMISESVFRFWRHKKQYRQKAAELLDLVGLGHRLHHRPTELSGGEMQRVAIARSLMSDPKILLADEPTGNLDQENGDEIMNLLRTLNENDDLTIVMVTHDQEVARDADHLIRLESGTVARKAA